MLLDAEGAEHPPPSQPVSGQGTQRAVDTVAQLTHHICFPQTSEQYHREGGSQAMSRGLGDTHHSTIPLQDGMPCSGTPGPCALPPLPTQGTEACRRGSHTHPRAGPLGNQALRFLILILSKTNAEGSSLEQFQVCLFLLFCKKEIWSLPTLSYGIISRDPTPKRQGSEEAVRGGPVPGGRWRTWASTAL